LLKTSIDVNVRYVLVVMKQVSNTSITSATYDHLLFNQRFYHGLNIYSQLAAIKFSATSSTKTINMNGAKKYKINGGALGPSYVTSDTSATLWLPNTNYIYGFELAAQSLFQDQSYFGGNSFNGQIADIILLQNATTMNEAQLDRIRDQLNTIHGAY
jgi:hypothetical protein